MDESSTRHLHVVHTSSPHHPHVVCTGWQQLCIKPTGFLVICKPINTDLEGGCLYLYPLFDANLNVVLFNKISNSSNPSSYLDRYSEAIKSIAVPIFNKT